ncbi:MAG: hypothetical protein J6386_13195 [Candidatus Synoicihabitans palmerolidicus]|nr:hypothetical protein [Candidatus Synoicihabitans palmerolidicus]
MLVSVAGAYVAMWVGLRIWSANFVPGLEVYDGARVSFSMEVFRTAGIYSLSGLPGLEVWLDRGNPTSLVVGPDIWLQRVTGNFEVWDLLSAVAVGAAVWAVGTRAHDRSVISHDSRAQLRLALVLVIWALGSQFLLAVTPKYQTWSHQRMWPYYQSMGGAIGWQVLVLVAVAQLGLGRLKGGLRTTRMLLALLAMTAAITILGVKAMNRVAVARFEKSPMYHYLSNSD